MEDKVKQMITNFGFKYEEFKVCNYPLVNNAKFFVLPISLSKEEVEKILFRLYLNTVEELEILLKDLSKNKNVTKFLVHYF